MGRGSSVNIVTRLRAGPAWAMEEYFLLAIASRLALGPTQPPIQCVPRALSVGLKWPGYETDRSPPSSAEVQNAWSIPSLPQYAFMAWCLVKHRDGFMKMLGGYCKASSFKKRDYLLKRL